MVVELGDGGGVGVIVVVVVVPGSTEQKPLPEIGCLGLFHALWSLGLASGTLILSFSSL